MNEFDQDDTAHVEDGSVGEASDETAKSANQYIESKEDEAFVKLALSCHRDSDDWFNSSIRKEAERAISNFRSKHPTGSKYYTSYYDKRSRLFRPKTRSMVRATEAAAGVAFFSTSDAVKCRALYEGNKQQRTAAEIFTALINHRLGDTDMHWFLSVIGATQDASTVGVVVSRQNWEYEARQITLDDKPTEVVTKDSPYCEILPLENVRISPASKWYDPVGTSPYVIELQPTYIGDIKARMGKTLSNGDPMYRSLDDGMLRAAQKQEWDTLRKIRQEGRMDPLEASVTVNDFDTVWVHHNIIKRDGVDWVFDTLGTELMLSHKARPLVDVYRHGMRPYAIGFMVVETHKIYPTGPVGLVEPLQEEANDIANLRIDNIRLALGKRYFVRRGRGVDTTSLTRNVPSSVTMVADPTSDVKEMTTQDVTRSSYEEQDRINMDFDELAGRFSGSSVGSNRKLGETVGGMSMLKEDANIIQEFQIRVFAETWVEPVMRQLVAMEAVYETDEELLTEVGREHGLDAAGVLEHMKLSKKIMVGVDVGFNATNPEKRIQKLSLGLNTISTMFPQLMATADPVEVSKEVFGALGYKDGTRFFPSLQPGGDDPRIAMLQQQIQQLQQALESGIEDTKIRVQGQIQSTQITAESRVAVAQIAAEVKGMEIESDNNVELFLVKMKNRLEEIDRAIAIEGSDVKRRELYLQREALSHSIQESDRQYALEVARMGQEQAEGEKDRAEGARDRDASVAAKSEGEGKPNGKGPKNLPGNDKAGVLGRDKYGDIPQAGG